MSQKLWTVEEDAILYAAYKEGVRSGSLVDQFPGRSANAIKVRMCRVARDVFNRYREDPRLVCARSTS